MAKCGENITAKNPIVGMAFAGNGFNLGMKFLAYCGHCNGFSGSHNRAKAVSAYQVRYALVANLRQGDLDCVPKPSNLWTSHMAWYGFASA